MHELSFPFRAMGSPCEVRLSGLVPENVQQVAELAIGEVARLEHKYSRYRADSVTAAINRRAGCHEAVEVDPETAGLLDYAETAWRQSKGLFDITSGVLRRAWNFQSGRLPSEDELDAVRAKIGWQRVSWQRPRLALPLAGMEIDFGGVVKEYAADRAAELCRRAGVSHGMIDLGGDISLVGPHPDGSPWRIGVRDPRRPEEALVTIGLERGAIASSGDYERGMVVAGVRYGHILDPTTGRPVERGLACASVVAPHCLVAGSAATIAMLLSADEAPGFLSELGLPHVWLGPTGPPGGTLATVPASVRTSSAAAPPPGASSLQR